MSDGKALSGKPWDDLAVVLAGSVALRPMAWEIGSIALPALVASANPVLAMPLAVLGGAIVGSVRKTKTAWMIAPILVWVPLLLAFEAVGLAGMAVSLTWFASTVAGCVIAWRGWKLPRVAAWPLVAAAFAFLLWRRDAGSDQWYESIGPLVATALVWISLPRMKPVERELWRFVMLFSVLLGAFAWGVRPLTSPAAALLALLGVASIVTALGDLVWSALRSSATESDGEEAWVRVLVRLQRRPWVAAFSVVLVADGLRMWVWVDEQAGLTGFFRYSHTLVPLLAHVFLVCAAAFLYQARGYQRASLDRAAPFAAFATSAFILGVPVFLAFSRGDIPTAFAMALATGLLLPAWAYGSGALLENRRVPQLVLLSAVVLLVGATSFSTRPAYVLIGVLAPPVLHAFARPDAPSLYTTFVAVALGSLLTGELPVVSRPGREHLLLFGVAAVFVVWMRAGRALCAVPLEHPVVVDFESGRPLGAGPLVGG